MKLLQQCRKYSAFVAETIGKNNLGSELVAGSVFAVPFVACSVVLC